jgi:hypothetical protein
MALTKTQINGIDAVEGRAQRSKRWILVGLLQICQQRKNVDDWAVYGPNGMPFTDAQGTLVEMVALCNTTNNEPLLPAA